MKVVHLIASSGLYGAEKWILALMRAMEKSPVESVLINLSDIKNITSAIVAGAHERGLNAYDFYTGGTFNPFAVFKFSRWLKHNNVDIVHGHGYKSDLIGLLAAKFSNCKMISTPHGWSKDGDRKLRLYESLDRYLFRFMDNVCPLSEELLEGFQSFKEPDKVQFIKNGVDIDEINTYLPAFVKNKNEFIVGYVGRLIEGKDIPTLMYAFKLLNDSVKKHSDLKVRMIIVGDGECSSDLKHLSHSLGLSSCIDFLGFCSDAISYLKCFDVFVLPSLSEGIPRCLMEAMASEVITVATEIRGNCVLVEHGHTGFLFKPSDRESLFLILKHIIKNKEQCYDITSCAKRLIEERFSSKLMATEYQVLYQGLSV